MPNKLSFPLFLVAPACLTMMRNAPPEALQLFSAKADADAFAARFPYTRRMTLTTPKDVAQMLRTAPGHYTAAAIRSGDQMARYEMSELAELCGGSLSADPADGPSPWLSARGSGRATLTSTAPAAAPPPVAPPPAAEPPDDSAARQRQQRELAYLREVQNS